MVELIKAGVNCKRIRDYLQQYAPDLESRFDDLMNEAQDDA